MSRVLIASVVLLTICLTLSTYAADVIKVDPNSSVAKTAEGIAPDGDPRLAQKVTYQAKRKTVLAILTDLSNQTGVTLKAGYSSEDWQVRDRRMNIFVKDLPLANLMNSIARVMKFEWSKSDYNGAASYRLYMNREILLGAERQRYLEEEKFRKRQSAARQKLISELDKAAGMSEDELEKLKEQSPYIYSMTKIGWDKLLPKMFTAVPAVKQALVSGSALTADINSLPADMQEAFRKCMGCPFNLSEGSVLINSVVGNAGYYRDAAQIGSIGFQFSGAVVVMNLLDPDSESARVEGEYEVKIASATTNKEDMKRIIDERVSGMDRAKKSENKDLGEPVIEHSDDPALSVKVKMKVGGHRFVDALAALAETSGFSIISDSFNMQYAGLNLASEETEVRTVLDQLQSACLYNWERHGSTIELHDRYWFGKRSAQIPDKWLEAWRKAFKENGLLGIDELSQIAQLTPEQYTVNIASDDILESASLTFLMAPNQELLNFYASLSKQQKALIWTEHGLDLSTLPNDQSPTIQALLQRIFFLQEENQKGLRLVGKRKTDKKHTYYDCSVLTSSGSSTGTRWTVYCPKYYPPVKEQPQDSEHK